MKQPQPRYDITDTTALEQLFDSVNEVSQLKELRHVDANYAAWILETISRQRIDGALYDRELPGRVRTTLY